MLCYVDVLFVPGKTQSTINVEFVCEIVSRLTVNGFRFGGLLARKPMKALWGRDVMSFGLTVPVPPIFGAVTTDVARRVGI